MQGIIADAYCWTPDTLDDLTLDRLEFWVGRATERIKLMTSAQCAFR